MPEPGPSASGDQPLIIWAVSDGRAGIQTQALGLAEALLRQCEAAGRNAQIVLKTVGWKGNIGRLPAVLNVLPKRWVTPESEITAPWPDVWIAAGRATLPLSVRMRAWSGSKTFVVQIQDPRMPLTTDKKQELINGHQTHATDTGSVEVQVAMLSERISQLTGHMQKNKHDYSSRQGLMKMLGRRKSLLSYLKAQDRGRYQTLISKLGIRG